MAIAEFVVSPLFGSPPAADLLRQQFVGALDGDVDVLGMLEKRDSDAANSALARAGEIQAGAPLTRSTAPPRILWLDAVAPGQLVVEVRAMDRIGLLALLAQALERAGATSRGRRSTPSGRRPPTCSAWHTCRVEFR